VARIPTNDISGVLPPFLGASPGGSPSEMAPYRVTVAEVVQRFATSPERAKILTGFLDYRAALRGAGISSGFQWIDGSFVEDVEASRGRAPADVDLVTFVSASQSGQVNALHVARHPLADRAHVKSAYSCDAFFVTLGSSPVSLVSLTRYWFGLFSHQRGTRIWKGMLEVPLDTTDDDLDGRRVLSSTRAPIVAPAAPRAASPGGAP
jgi:hypothetical protein